LGTGVAGAAASALIDAGGGVGLVAGAGVGTDVGAGVSPTNGIACGVDESLPMVHGVASPVACGRGGLDPRPPARRTGSSSWSSSRGVGNVVWGLLATQSSWRLVEGTAGVVGGVLSSRARFPESPAKGLRSMGAAVANVVDSADGVRGSETLTGWGVAIRLTFDGLTRGGASDLNVATPRTSANSEKSTSMTPPSGSGRGRVMGNNDTTFT
jgi:hypothetical protein